MGLLRLAVLGPPEVVHEGRRLTSALRKAQALLLYLAVEGEAPALMNHFGRAEDRKSTRLNSSH